MKGFMTIFEYRDFIVLGKHVGNYEKVVSEEEIKTREKNMKEEIMTREKHESK